MSDETEEFCQGYDGVEYHPSGEELAMMTPDAQVALNTIVYVRGVGMNLRVVTVPGSDWAMFWEETQGFGVCQCTPPAVWYFVGIDGGRVCTHTTLSGHEAVHFMRHPDHLFEEKDNEPGGLHEQLTLVPAEDGLDMVMIELQDHMVAMGVPDIKEEGEITYQDVKSVDIDDMISKFMEGRDDD